jgi:predicted nucleotidyltransferase
MSLDDLDETVQRILKELKNRLQSLYGSRLARVILFGSQARREAEPHSDIDILLVFHGPVNRHDDKERAIEVTSALSLENDTVISCLYMSEDRFLHEDAPLLRNIRREGLTI